MGLAQFSIHAAPNYALLIEEFKIKQWEQGK